MEARASYSHHLSLAEVAARLEKRPEVDGVLMMGSGGSGALTPSSDIDLLVVLASGSEMKMISTTLEGRLSEIYFAGAEDLDRFAFSSAVLPEYSFEAARMRWIQTGTILFDRSGRLARTRQALAQRAWSAQPSDAELYEAWYATNYDLVQTRRLVTAEDSVSWMKADLRLLFMLHDVWERYFLARRLPAQGDKARIRWMAAQDPGFYALFQRCLAESGRAARFELYCELAGRALAPLGPLWPETMTAVQLDEASPSGAAAVLERWRAWLAEG